MNKELFVVKEGGIVAAVDAAIAFQKAKAGGLAELDGDALLPLQRLPNHKSRHAVNGLDPLSPGDVGAVPEGDARLSDARTPTAHDHDSRYWTEIEADARYVRGTRTILTQSPLTGGGDLQADRTLGLEDVTGLAPGTYERATVTVDQKGRVTSVAAGAAGAVSDASTTVKGVGTVDTPPEVATDPVFVGRNSYVFENFLTGLAFRRDAANGYTVGSGAAWVPGLKRVLNAPAPISKTGLTLAASTWYYVYLFFDTATGAANVEHLTVAPAAPYKAGARVHPTDNSRRFVRSFRTGTTGAILRQNWFGDSCYYDDNHPDKRIVNGGGGGTIVTVTASNPYMPPTSTLFRCGLYAAAGRYAVTAFPGWAGGNTVSTTNTLYVKAGPTPPDWEYFWHETDASQRIIYSYDAINVATVYMDVLGYYEERS